MEFLIFFGAGLVLLGLFYIFSDLRQRRTKFKGHKQWPQVRGKVVKTWVGKREYQDSDYAPVVDKYEPFVTYSYQVGDIAYTGTHFGFYPREYTADPAAAYCDLYTAGDEVQVNYNPESPRQSVLLTRVKPRLLGYPVVRAGASLAVLGALTIVLAIALL